MILSQIKLDLWGGGGAVKVASRFEIGGLNYCSQHPTSPIPPSLSTPNGLVALGHPLNKCSFSSCHGAQNSSGGKEAMPCKGYSDHCY